VSASRGPSALQHQFNAVRIVRATALIEVAGLLKLGADPAKRLSLSRGTLGLRRLPIAMAASCQPLLDPSNDFCSWCRLANNRRVIGLLGGGVQDERSPLWPSSTAAERLGRLAKSGSAFLAITTRAPFFLECVSKCASDQPRPLDDQDRAALRRIPVGH